MAHKGTTVFTPTGQVSTLMGHLQAAFFDTGQRVVPLRNWNSTRTAHFLNVLCMLRDRPAID